MFTMKRQPITAFLLTLAVPGLGHIYSGNGNKGAIILVSAIIIGSLNIMFLPVFNAANPDPDIIWAYWIPRIGHDVIAFWSIVFWLWAVFDAYQEANKA